MLLRLCFAIAMALFPGPALTQEVPPRLDFAGSFHALGAERLYAAIRERGGVALVALKAPGMNQGYWNGTNQLSPDEEASARSRVLAVDDVRAYDNRSALPKDIMGRSLPFVAIEVASVRTLQEVMSLDVVEYVDPYYINMLSAGLAGCSGNESESTLNIKDPEGGHIYDCAKNPCSMPIPGLADVAPYNYAAHGIVKAWKVSKGAGVTVTVLDTGVFDTQYELRNSAEVSGGLFDWNYATRTAEYIAVPSIPSGSLWDVCNHGTRMAGLIGAPADGYNIAGVAHHSNLRMYKVNDNVYADKFAILAVAAALQDAVNYSDIFAMAFGEEWKVISLDKVMDQEATRNPRVLYVAAAGTLVPGQLVVWPGRKKHPNVTTVTFVNMDDSERSDASYGAPVHLAIRIGADLPSTGRRVGDMITMGGSSSGTAYVAAMAAMLRTRYGGVDAPWIRARLIWSTNSASDGRKGFGAPNAFKSLGGLVDVAILGPPTVNSGSNYTLTVDTVGADGPFSYQWNGPETSDSITRTGGTAGTCRTHTVTVTQISTAEAVTASKKVCVPRAPVKPLCSTALAERCVYDPARCSNCEVAPP